MDTLAGLDATEQAELVAAGVLTAADLLEAAAARIALVEPQIRALVTVDLSRRGRARGPFAGVPFLVKDSTPYPGLPWRMGTRVSLTAPPTPLAKRIDDAGLVVIGKTAMSELGLLASTESLAFGPTHNPWDLAYSAGGSSGGAAAAVAAGIVPLAHANDGGGSTRIPAAVCGVFGFKPSRNRTVASGLGRSDFAEMTSDGCVSRTVRDAARFISLIGDVPFVAGPAKRRLRIGAWTRTYDGREPDPEVQRAHAATIELLEDLGHRVEEITPPVLDLDSLGDAFFTVAGAAVEPWIGRGELEPFTRALYEQRGSLERARDVLEIAARVQISMMRGFDAVLTPVVATLPWRLGHLSPTVPANELKRRTAELNAYAPLHNVVGSSAMSVPLHASKSGLPIGAHFAAMPGGDEILLALAYDLEEAKPWAERIPPVCALRTPD